jgi:tRNA1Val (adenine37-N6)-methyltransferase
VALGVATTTDSLLSGSLELLQPKAGYRVNVDSLLLVGFAGERRVDRVIDLGAGVGALGLLALHHGIAKRAILIEADSKLVVLARENLRRSGFDGEIHELDLRKGHLRDSAAPLVLCNPPYYPAHSHRPAAPSRAAARSGELSPFLAASAALIARKTGRALFCYPAPQLADLLRRAEDVGLIAKRLRLVHAREDKPARLALVELRAARPGGLVVEPPLFEWLGRRRSPELLRLSEGRAADRK